MPVLRVRRLIPRRAGVSWLILVAATITSVALGFDHGTGANVSVLVLAVAAIKVRLIGLDFMELRRAPLPLRLVFEAYVVGLWCLLAGLYMAG